MAEPRRKHEKEKSSFVHIHWEKKHHQEDRGIIKTGVGLKIAGKETRRKDKGEERIKRPLERC